MELETRAESLAEELRRATWDLHQRAEKHPGHAALFRAAVPFDFFLDQATQTLLVQRALDAALAEVRLDPLLAPLVEDYHIRAGLLEADLSACGRDTAAAHPLAATRALLARIDEGRTKPEILAGVLYVLEGSTNGAKFIARALRRAYRRDDDSGLRWLDPHGDRQEERWSRFRAALGAARLTAKQRSATIAAARDTFAWTIGVLDELIARYGVKADGRG